MTSYTVPAGGERLDRIARALYGSERGGTVEALLDANPGIADLPVILPAGTVLAVPERVVGGPAGYVLPWDV